MRSPVPERSATSAAVFWLTKGAEASDAEAAERFMRDVRGEWRVDAEVFLAPTEEWIGYEDDDGSEWEESEANARGHVRDGASSTLLSL